MDHYRVKSMSPEESLQSRRISILTIEQNQVKVIWHLELRVTEQIKQNTNIFLHF